jgi:hypothetical protein
VARVAGAEHFADAAGTGALEDLVMRQPIGRQGDQL